MAPRHPIRRVARVAAVVPILALMLACARNVSTAPVATPAATDWTLVLNRPIPGKYEDFTFPTLRQGWATTAFGDILHTADGGATWTVQKSGLGNVRSVDFLDEITGFAGTLGGQLHVTRDGGKTWTPITATLPKPPRGFCGITHVGKQVHIVGRYVGAVTDYFYSPDAGFTWRHTDLSAYAQGLVDVAFVSGSVGFIGGMAKSAVVNQGVATILKTTDGGKTWRPVYVHDGGRGFVWKLWPITTKLIYAALQSQDGVYRVAKTTDGGEHWETLVVAKDRPPGFGVQGIGFLDANRGWVGGFFEGMYATTDGGKTWTFISTPDVQINRFEKVGRSLFTGSTRGILQYNRSITAQR